MRRLFALLLVSLPLPARALEVRVHPADSVYAYEVDSRRGVYSVVLQNIAVVQGEGQALTLDSVEIQAVSAGQALQTLTVPAADLEKSAQKMNALEAQGIVKLYDFYFQTSRYLAGLRLAPGLTLEPGTALVISGKPLLLSGIPSDGLVLIARGKDAAGKDIEARKTLKVSVHSSPNDYLFPIAGTTYIAVGPSLDGPHRWVTNEEFALDLAATGGDGRFHKGDGSRLDDYYAYGKDVRAVADGTVVEVATDATEANDRLKRPDESAKDFEMRTFQAQNELLAKSTRAPLGNYVILRHAGGEFSHYAHLKQGSVKVKAGDTVTRGQVIGQLGHTGNSTEPHLHFQLTDGADPLYSRGIPIVFKDVFVEGLAYEGRPLQSGWVVTAR